MLSKNNTLSRLMFSAAGIAAVALLLIAINVIASMVNGRVDMTEEKRYTLSAGTRAILKTIDAPVSVRLYYSRDVKNAPVWMKNYAPRVRDMLKEYKLIAKGGLIIEEKNPAPDSDDEESAVLDGVHGQMLPDGGQLYFGLAFSCLDESEVIPVLSPRDESMLEYDITRAIFQVLTTEKPAVGVMAGLPVLGSQPDMMMMAQGMGGQGTPAWYVFEDLKKDVTVKEIPLDAETIDADIDILVVAHPHALSQKTLFAIDQFVLKGGKLIAFLDPMNYVEIYQQQNDPRLRGQPPRSSDLAPLLAAWGVEYRSQDLLADITYQTQNGRQRDPFILTLTRDAYNTEDPACAKLDNGMFVYAGAFFGDPVGGLTKTVLVESSTDAAMIDGVEARGMAIPDIVKTITDTDVKNALAIRLTGTFPTAFPDGAPTETDEDTERNAPAPAESAPPPPRTSGQSAVVLVADADLLHDAFCVEQINLMGRQLLRQTTDNVAFVHNLIEHLTGDMNLLSVRSLGVKSRPLTTFQKMWAAAEKEYQTRIAKLEEDLSAINQELSQLQQAKNPDQRFVLTPEQEAKLLEAQRKKAQTAKELKDVRKEFRKDIERLQNTLKFANIAAVPLAVALAGIVVALIKRRRMSRT
ncbi:MAG: Gldg family protein [Lentisphaeria bacterium]|nr:Gldg family protein [Lentisphaeria bacterium]